MCDQTYNGYPNRETWAAALWQDNDEDIYDRVREMAAEAIENHTKPWGLTEEDDYDKDGTRYELAQAIEQMWGEFADADEYRSNHGEVDGWVTAYLPMLIDVGSLWRVDWDFIADSVLSE